MGNNNAAITQKEFLKSWRQSDTLDGFTLWENKDDPNFQLEEYSVPDYDQHLTQKLYKLRKGSAYLVNAYSLQKDGLNVCGSSHQQTKIFVEKIPLRLSNVTDIPYPDVLHLYDVCINGFRQLSEMVGFFSVDEDYIGVNQHGQVRVWLNTAFENSAIFGRKDLTEAQMVEGILQIIHNTTDHQSYPSNIPNLSEYLGISNNQTTFDSVMQKFTSFVRQYNQSNIPLSLSCVQKVGGAHQVKYWCRSNNSFGFQEASMRKSQRVYQSKQGTKINRASLSVDLQNLPSSYRYQSQPINFNSSLTQNGSNDTAQFQSVKIKPLIVEQEKQRIFSVQSTNITNPVQTQRETHSIPIHSIPTFKNYSNEPIVVQFLPQKTLDYSVVQNNKENIVEMEIRQQKNSFQNQKQLLQQPVSSPFVKTTQQKINSQRQQTNVATPAISQSPKKQSNEPIQTQQNKKSNQFNRSKVNDDNDGKSSPEFLSLLANLKKSSLQDKLSEVYSQVADTPSAYAKQNSEASSRKKYFNYPNMHETYSQDAFSNYGQDSHKNIGSNVVEAPTFAHLTEQAGGKYSGQYNFSKYNRQIDPQLMADLQRYK